MAHRLTHRLLTGIAVLGLVVSACGGGSGGGGAKAPTVEGPVATKLQTTTDGWSFPNFPSTTYKDVEFNADDIVSMFGAKPSICTNGTAKGCVLTAEAAAWARMVNQARASGHCEGLVALASVRFNDAQQPSTVKLPTDPDTLHAIMRAFATQFEPEVQKEVTAWLGKSLQEKVDTVAASLAKGKLNYTLGLYTEGGGHALLPYAIEFPQPKKPRIRVYDSNWPGKNRYVDVDLEAGTWTFSYSGEDPETDPAKWTGDGGYMDLTSLDTRAGTCPFCDDGAKLQETTLLVRSSNLDWSVESDGKAASPTDPHTGEDVSVEPVKGGGIGLQRASYDYVVHMRTPATEVTTTTAAKAAKKSKMRFSGSTSVFALMPKGIAQFTTNGKSGKPIEMQGSAISAQDPSINMTLASGNLVANASGAAVALSAEGEKMSVQVTTANGQVITQEVSPDKPTLQMKADPSGGVTVLAATATGAVEKTEVSSDGKQTKSIAAAGSLDLNSTTPQLPPELASKENTLLPPVTKRDMANPEYKVDVAYTPPTTTTVPKNDVQNASSSKSSNNPEDPTTTVKGQAAKTADVPGAPSKPTLGRFTITDRVFGDAPFTLPEPTSNSTGAWTWKSSNPDVATIGATTGRVTITGGGEVTITGTQASTKNYETGTVTATFTVDPGAPTLGPWAAVTKTVGDDPFVLKAPSSNSDGAFVFDSSDDSVVKIGKSTGKVTVVGAGKSTITAAQAATKDFVTANRKVVITVKKAAPEYADFADVSKTFGDSDFVVAAPISTSRAPYQWSSSDTSVATVNPVSGSVSLVGAGRSTITAAQAGNDDYLAGTKSMTLTVAAGDPKLGTLSDVSATFGDPDFTVARPASASSGSFSFSSSNTAVVTVSASGVATITGGGKATVTVTQAATSTHLSRSATFTVTVGRNAARITDLALSNLTYGGPPVILKPKSNSPAAFRFSSNRTAVLAVDSSTGAVTIVGAGTATITVTQEATTSYEAATESITVNVAKAAATVGVFAASVKNYGDTPFTIAAPVSENTSPFSYASSNTAVATVNSSTGVVSITGVGQTTITASQAASANHLATTTTTTLTVDRGTPSYGDFVVADRLFSATPFTLTAPTSTSGSAFIYTSSNTAVATVDPATGVVTMVGLGTTTIRASQLANGLWVAGAISTTFTVGSAVPVLGAFTVPARTYGDAPFTLTAPTSNSAGAITFSSSNSSVATVVAATGVVTVVGGGTSVITATQAASGLYTTTSTTANLVVGRAAMTLSSFGGSAPGLVGTRYVGYFNDDVNWFDTAPLHGDTNQPTDFTYFSSSADSYSWQWVGSFLATTTGSHHFCTDSDDASYLWIGANAESGFTTGNALVNNGSPHGMRTVCNDVTLTGGVYYPIRIQFGEAGGGDAIRVWFNEPGSSTDVFDGTGHYFSSGGITKTQGDAPFTPTLPTSASPGAITYSSSDTAVAAINATTGLITVVGPGTATLTATQAQTVNYTGSSVTTDMTVLRLANLRSYSVADAMFGDSPFTPDAPLSDSPGAITYSSSNTAVATVNSTTGVVTPVNVGTATITATQAQTATYASATVSDSMSVTGTTITQVSVGMLDTCAVTTTHNVMCWGWNDYGNLGDQTTSHRNTPTRVTSVNGTAASVSAGAYDTCIVTITGGAKCWGRNGWGQLGNGSNSSSNTAVDVVGLSSGVSQIAVGEYSTCGLLTTGAVKCWGHNGQGQLGNGTWNDSNVPVDVTGLQSGVVSIKAGNRNFCALLGSGALQCWGNNDYWQLGGGGRSNQNVPVVAKGLAGGVLDFDLGSYHTCASLVSGGVKCWGHNGQGQLGTGNNNDYGSAVSVVGLSGIYPKIGLGERNSCAVDDVGNASCWGQNNWGQLGLGNGDWGDKNTPYEVNTTAKFASMEGGFGWHMCGMTADAGFVKCWGRGDEGEMGDSTWSRTNTPVNVGGLTPSTVQVTRLTAITLPGSGYTESSPNFFITAPTSNRTGSILFSSSNPGTATIDPVTGEVDIVGPGETMFTATQQATGSWTKGTSSVRLVLAPTVTGVSVGYYSGCGVTKTGAALCWGNNDWGQLGDGSNTQSFEPGPVSGLSSGVAKVVTSLHNSCAVLTTGALKCWGWNGGGQLGNGNRDNQSTPVNVSGLGSGVVDFSAGQDFGCAVMAWGGVKCLGAGPYGQLGDGTGNDSSTALDVVGLSSGATAVSAAYLHACALMANGGVKCWGHSDSGQLGDGTNTRRYRPVDVTGISTATSVSVGADHSCALLANGTVRCWGYNGVGALGDGTYTSSNVPVQVSGITDATSLTSGWDGNCVTTSAGAVKCWGRGDFGQLGNGATANSNIPVDVSGLTSGVLTVTSGWSHSYCATKSSGTVKCWGYNAWGQLGTGDTTNRSTPADAPLLVSGASTATTLGALALPAGSFNTLSSDFTLAAPTQSRAGTVRYGSSDTSVATIDESTGLVHVTGVGTAVLAAHIGGTGTYDGARSVVTLTVGYTCADGGACTVGDTGPGGGIVFYDAGSNKSWGRYLEAAPNTWSGASSDPLYAFDDATGPLPAATTAIGQGMTLTAAAAAGGSTAATQARAYSVVRSGVTYNDWFIPSKGELDELYAQRSVVGGLASAQYWSSNRDTATATWALSMSTGTQAATAATSALRVRPVRAFLPLTDCQLGISCNVGDVGPAGGLIAYVNPSASNTWDYVEAAPQNATSEWCNVNTTAGTAPYTAIEYVMQANARILGTCATGVGVQAWSYSSRGIGGWTVPNVALMNQLKANLADAGLGGFTAGTYLTAEESGSSYFALNVNNGSSGTTLVAKATASPVRYVRFFTKSSRKPKASSLYDVSVPATTVHFGDGDFTAATSGYGRNELGDALGSSGYLHYSSSNTAVVTVNEYTGAVRITGSGTARINVVQDAWGVFSAPEARGVDITVLNGVQTVSGLALPGTSYRADDAPFDLTAPSSTGPSTVVYTSSDPTVATVDSSTGRVTILKAGVTTLTATKTALTNWDAASQSVSLYVGALCKDGGVCRVGDTGPGGGIIYVAANTSGNTSGYIYEMAPSNWTASLDAADTWANAKSTAEALILGGQSDWYLPSEAEMNEVCKYSHGQTTGVAATACDGNPVTRGGLVAAAYWTSTEVDSTNAKTVNISTGVTAPALKSLSNKVRPVRSWQMRNSCNDIKTATGTNTNGVYSINVDHNGTMVLTDVYCLMDSAMDGGGWTLVMKADRGSTTFNYSANYWTTANTLNPTNNTLAAGDAKFDTFNYLKGTDLLAVFPDAGTNGGSITGHAYGWTWEQKAFTVAPKSPLEIFTGGVRQSLGDPLSFAGWKSGIFSSQGGFKWYGFNYDRGTGAVRWGFGWNNEGDEGSNDVFGGIGMERGSYSAGDVIQCCQNTTGLNRSMAVQMFVR